MPILPAPPLPQPFATTATEILIVSGPEGLTTRSRPVRARALPSLPVKIPPQHDLQLPGGRFEIRDALGHVIYWRPLVDLRKAEVITPDSQDRVWINAPARQIRVVTLLLPFEEQHLLDNNYSLRLHQISGLGVPTGTQSFPLPEIITRSRV
jgi:hypothetical protein